MSLDERNLAELIRAVVQTTMAQAPTKARTSARLQGTVEEIDEDLDVLYVRMDPEMIGSNVYASDNFENPGVLPASRLGETFRDEQVRVTFVGSSGADAMRTSAESSIVLPFGAESGRRIVLDGDNGWILFFDESDDLVAYMASDQWAIGDISTPGERVAIDPLGGIRMHTSENVLVTVIDQRGYSLRAEDSGIVTAEIKPGSFRMVDPVGTDDIEMVTSSQGTLPNPAYRVAPEINPGTSLAVPAAPTMTIPVTDIAVSHVAAWRANINQSATMLYPAGMTGRHNGTFTDAGGSLQTAVATAQPATGNAHQYTSSLSNWQHGLGTHVILSGGGPSVPTFRSLTTTTAKTTSSTITLTTNTPAGVVANDVLVVFVSLGAAGGLVPTGWVTPQGWVFLGAEFSTSGTGSSMSTLSTGAWARLAVAGEPASHSTQINLPTGVKYLQGTMVAIQNAFLAPGGVQIRLAGRPIRRLLDFQQLQSNSLTLCDFTGISPGYDNLEIVFDAQVGTTHASNERKVQLQFNGDTGTNYFLKVIDNGVAETQGAGVDRIDAGQLGRLATSRSAGTVHVYGYASSTRPIALGQNFWVRSSSAGTGSLPELHSQEISGQWNASAAINRVRLFCTSGGPDFGAGSRAYLYGY